MNRRKYGLCKWCKLRAGKALHPCPARTGHMCHCCDHCTQECEIEKSVEKVTIPVGARPDEPVRITKKKIRKSMFGPK